MRVAPRTDLRMDPEAWPTRRHAGEAGHAHATSGPREPQAPGSRGRGPRTAPGDELTPEQKAQVEKLKQIDQRVRAHEAAHLAAGGGLAMGGATYGYVQGPDGQRYATSGEVQIDTSPGKTPEETIEKARQIQRAAMAPSDPSGQDRAVAAQAGAMMAQARQDLARQQAEGSGEGDRPDTPRSRFRGASESGERPHPLRGAWRPVDLHA
jgi:hypothetical protein